MLAVGSAALTAVSGTGAGSSDSRCGDPVSIGSEPFSLVLDIDAVVTSLDCLCVDFSAVAAGWEVSLTGDGEGMGWRLVAGRVDSVLDAALGSWG